MLRLYLARHGETTWNRAGRYQGCIDTPLSRAGHEQARALARALTDVPLSAVYTSPLRRALDTARVVAATADCPLRDVRGLREICHGDWEGLTVGDVERQFPALWRRWREEPESVVMPKGESLADVQERAVEVVRRIISDHPGQTVALITHGVTARVILTWALCRPLATLWEIDVPAATITELDLADGGCAVLRLNATAHLPERPRRHAAL